MIAHVALINGRRAAPNRPRARLPSHPLTHPTVRSLVCQPFVSPGCTAGDLLDLLNRQAQYDDDSDEWQIKYIALSGNNIAQTKRISEGRAGLSLGLAASEPAEPSSAHRRPQPPPQRTANGAQCSRSDPYLRLTG